jgi:hypothetical protein
MVEPRTHTLAGDATGKAVNVDVTDMGISKISMIGDSQFQNQYGTGGFNCTDTNA